MTIMTQEFAEKCYLTRLIDKRFHGMAMGVGTSRIVGRIHQVGTEVGSAVGDINHSCRDNVPVTKLPVC